MPRRVVHRDIYGKLDGNFSPHQPMEDFLRSIRKLRQANPKLETIFAPKCDFTTRIVKLGEEDEVWDTGFIRTKNPADGGIVDKPNQAIAIFNADCPVVSIFDEEQGRLAVLHAGFRCLFPVKPFIYGGVVLSGNPSIISLAFGVSDFSSDRVKVFVGYGIGPCCYGANHWPEVNADSRFISIGKATRGPRVGQYEGERSVDLYESIQPQLHWSGVDYDNVLIDSRCTACHRVYGKRLYHSKVYEGKSAGRNAVLIWYEED